MFKIHWMNNITGEAGNGNYISERFAKSTVDTMNKTYPHIRHWVVKQ